MTRFGLLYAQHLTLSAAVIHHGLPLTVHAQQGFIVLFLDARLADDLSLVVLGVVRNIELRFADFARITDHVGEDAVVGVKPPLRFDQFHLRKRIGIAMRFHKRQLGRRQLFFDNDGLITRTILIARDFPDQIVVIEVETIGNLVQMLVLQVLPRENQAPRGMVVDNHAAVSIENLPARGHDRQGFDPVSLRAFVVDFRALDLQFPESGYQKQKNGDGKVLKRSHFGGGETGVVPQLDFAGARLLFGMVFERRKAHGNAEADFRLAESLYRLRWVVRFLLVHLYDYPALLVVGRIPRSAPDPTVRLFPDPQTSRKPPRVQYKQIGDMSMRRHNPLTGLSICLGGHAG